MQSTAHTVRQAVSWTSMQGNAIPSAMADSLLPSRLPHRPDIPPIHSYHGSHSRRLCELWAPAGVSRGGGGGVGQPGGGAVDGESAGGVEAARAARAELEGGAGGPAAARGALDGGG